MITCVLRVEIAGRHDPSAQAYKTVRVNADTSHKWANRLTSARLERLSAVPDIHSASQALRFGHMKFPQKTMTTSAQDARSHMNECSASTRELDVAVSIT